MKKETIGLLGFYLNYKECEGKYGKSRSKKNFRFYLNYKECEELRLLHPNLLYHQFYLNYKECEVNAECIPILSKL